MFGMFTPSTLHFEDIATPLAISSLRFLPVCQRPPLIWWQKVSVRSLQFVTNLHLCRNMPTFIALVTDLKKGEIITELLSVCKVTFRVKRHRQEESIHETECLGCPD